MADKHKAKARRLWPRAAWIIGRGQFASVAHCRAITVMLFETRAEAERAKQCIDHTACGGGCYRAHEIVEL